MPTLKTRQQVPNLLGTPGGIAYNRDAGTRTNGHRPDAAASIEKLTKRKNENPPVLACKEERSSGIEEIDYGHNW